MRTADESDFTDFVAGSSRQLFDIAYLLTGDSDEAARVLQNALDRTYRSWPRLNRDGVADAYVRQVLVSAAAPRWRRHPARIGLDVAEQSSDPSQPCEPVQADREAVLRAVRGLPAAQQAVLVLQYFEGLTQPQVAVVMGWTPSAVNSQHAKAMARLATVLPAEGA